jgi:hypothetical protein
MLQIRIDRDGRYFFQPTCNCYEVPLSFYDLAKLEAGHSIDYVCRACAEKTLVSPADIESAEAVRDKLRQAFRESKNEGVLAD